MSALENSWVVQAIDANRIASGNELIHRHLLIELAERRPEIDLSEDIEFLSEALQIAVEDAFDVAEPDKFQVRLLSSNAFELLRQLTPDPSSNDFLEHALRAACHGILADRGPDVGRFLKNIQINAQADGSDWCERVQELVFYLWILLIRKDGWEDLDLIQDIVLQIRIAQEKYEAPFLERAGDQARAAAWRLIATYHLAKAAEILAIYTIQGEVNGTFDIRQQLDAQFDRSIISCERAELVDLFSMVKLLAKAAEQLVANSIWTVTRAVNSRVSKFVSHVVNREQRKPIFEMLAPQRIALREQGLLGSSRRAVVVSLPTSSGKTMIAQFRILQALNQFEMEAGWVAYVAPTKALVNQISLRLRRDFQKIGINVEKISPALEFDAVEEQILIDKTNSSFRVLVSTPEKLDLLLRGGWEAKIGRPLTLVVVDEAHNLSGGERGLRLELLLATINRECKNSQFLLLTPFVPNAADIANWLSPDNSTEISIGYDWSPNDRTVGVVQACKNMKKGDFDVKFEAVHTTRNTIASNDKISLISGRPLGLTWSGAKGLGNTAAVAAHALSERGSQIVVGPNIPSTWAIARTLSRNTSDAHENDPDIELVQNFVSDEFGPNFELIEMLSKGVGLHHSGLSDETRALMEWLTENEKINYLVATTTIAQGVNFPVSGVIMAGINYPYGVEMTSDEFWNLAGRAGRADQAKLGVVAIAAKDDDHASYLKNYIIRSAQSLNSTLENMVSDALKGSDQIDLTALFHKKEWSSFLQYIAHSYRQIADHNQFNSQIEQVLRGSFGYQSIRRTNSRAASALISAVQRYSNLIRGRPLTLVDSTGFCWESVSIALSGLREENITKEIWDPSTIFEEGNDSLRRAFGILFRIPELRDELADATSGRGKDSGMLARVVKDWVKGATVEQIAQEHFQLDADDPSASLTKVSRSVYGSLIQTASWGVSALQSMTLGEDFESASDAERREIRNLPAKIYYGVDNDSAVALRLAGVPRRAASSLSPRFPINDSFSISQIRSMLSENEGKIWSDAIGIKGNDYKKIWNILEGGNITST